MTIEGSKFGNAPRVLINTIDKIDFVKTVSDILIKLKGKAKKLGLKTGDNTIQVVDATGVLSNLYILRR